MKVRVTRSNFNRKLRDTTPHPSPTYIPEVGDDLTLDAEPIQCSNCRASEPEESRAIRGSDGFGEEKPELPEKMSMVYQESSDLDVPTINGVVEVVNKERRTINQLIRYLKSKNI